MMKFKRVRQVEDIPNQPVHRKTVNTKPSALSAEEKKAASMAECRAVLSEMEVIQMSPMGGSLNTAAPTWSRNTAAALGAKMPTNELGNLHLRQGSSAHAHKFSRLSIFTSSTTVKEAALSSDAKYLQEQRQRNKNSPKAVATTKDAGNTPPFRRFGSRRSSQRKAVSTADKSSGARNVATAASKVRSDDESKPAAGKKRKSEALDRDSSDGARERGPGTADAGHTPKSKRIKRVSSTLVYSLLQKESSDEGPENACATQNIPLRKSSTSRKSFNSKLRSSSRKLKRSMSMLCSGGRSRAVAGATSTDAPTSGLVRNEPRRKSLSAGVLMSIMPKSRAARDKKRADKEKENGGAAFSLVPIDLESARQPHDESPCPDEVENDVFLNSSAEENGAKPREDAAAKGDEALFSRRLSLKRRSVRQPPRDDRDRAGGGKETEAAGGATGNSRVLHRGSSRRSLRRKSLGGATGFTTSWGSPTLSDNRRASGVYRTTTTGTHTPTFMACGLVMTDSPEEPFHPVPQSASMLLGHADRIRGGGKSGAIPKGGKNGATPKGGKSGATPKGGNSGATPKGGKSGATPKGGKNGATPKSGKSRATPKGGNSGATPKGGKSGVTPKGTQIGKRAGTPHGTISDTSTATGPSRRRNKSNEERLIR